MLETAKLFNSGVSKETLIIMIQQRMKFRDGVMPNKKTAQKIVEKDLYDYQMSLIDPKERIREMLQESNKSK